MATKELTLLLLYLNTNPLASQHVGEMLLFMAHAQAAENFFHLQEPTLQLHHHTQCLLLIKNANGDFSNNFALAKEAVTYSHVVKKLFQYNGLEMAENLCKNAFLLMLKCPLQEEAFKTLVLTSKFYLQEYQRCLTHEDLHLFYNNIYGFYSLYSNHDDVKKWFVGTATQIADMQIDLFATASAEYIIQQLISCFQNGNHPISDYDKNTLTKSYSYLARIHNLLGRKALSLQAYKFLSFYYQACKQHSDEERRDYAEDLLVQLRLFSEKQLQAAGINPSALALHAIDELQRIETKEGNDCILLSQFYQYLQEDALSLQFKELAYRPKALTLHSIRSLQKQPLLVQQLHNLQQVATRYFIGHCNNPHDYQKNIRYHLQRLQHGPSGKALLEMTYIRNSIVKDSTVHFRWSLTKQIKQGEGFKYCAWQKNVPYQPNLDFLNRKDKFHIDMLTASQQTFVATCGYICHWAINALCSDEKWQQLACSLSLLACKEVDHAVLAVGLSENANLEAVQLEEAIIIDLWGPAQVNFYHVSEIQNRFLELAPYLTVRNQQKFMQGALSFTENYRVNSEEYFLGQLAAQLELLPEDTDMDRLLSGRRAQLKNKERTQQEMQQRFSKLPTTLPHNAALYFLHNPATRLQRKSAKEPIRGIKFPLRDRNVSYTAAANATMYTAHPNASSCTHSVSLSSQSRTKYY